MYDPADRNAGHARISPTTTCPTHGDIPEIDVQFVGEPDTAFNPIGARGMGEIGITGIAAAIANAVFHATGKRVRELPITPDKLLDVALTVPAPMPLLEVVARRLSPTLG